MNHNSTPASVLEAPEQNVEIIEGTEFTGLNRKQARARAKSMGYKFSGTRRMAGSFKTAPHWLAEALAESSS